MNTLRALWLTGALLTYVGILVMPPIAKADQMDRPRTFGNLAS